MTRERRVRCALFPSSPFRSFAFHSHSSSIDVRFARFIVHPFALVADARAPRRHFNRTHLARAFARTSRNARARCVTLFFSSLKPSRARATPTSPRAHSLPTVVRVSARSRRCVACVVVRRRLPTSRVRARDGRSSARERERVNMTSTPLDASRRLAFDESDARAALCDDAIERTTRATHASTRTRESVLGRGT